MNKSALITILVCITAISTVQAVETPMTQVGSSTYFAIIKQQIESVKSFEDLNEILSNLDEKKLKPHEVYYIEGLVKDFIPDTIGQKRQIGENHVNSSDKIIYLR